MKTKWMKQSLSTHFAGATPKVMRSLSYAEFINNAIVECLGNKCECPVSKQDTFSEGVYYNKSDVECFVKFNNQWYEYETKMFMHYQTELNVAELDTSVRNAIVNIAKTKFATPLQIELADKVKWLKTARSYKLQGFQSRKRLIKKIEELKLKKKVVGDNENKKD